jgi:flotillin
MTEHNESQPFLSTETKQIMGAVGLGTLVGIGGFIAYRYRVAGPSEYIIRTGIGIENVSVTKKALQFPFQTFQKMSIAPATFPIEIDAMSAQRIPFRMPSVWTIGPKNELDSLERYATLLGEKGADGVKETVEGVIQGETRVLTANIDLGILFSDRDTFKNDVVTRINEVMDPFGLTVYNANIAELADLDEENRYFEEQKRRALQRVNQEARVDTAEAIKDGEIGEMAFLGETRQKVAGIETEAKIVENTRLKDIAESNKDLSVAEAEYSREIRIAEIEAEAKAQARQWKLQHHVEEARQKQQTVNLRADMFTRADIQAEVDIREAEGFSKAIMIKSEAELFAKQQEAVGILAIKQAEAEGLLRLVESAGSVNDLNHYMMVRDGMLQDIAKQQADALTGLNPKISIWNTGDSKNGQVSDVLADIFKTGMPLFDGIKEQTGYDVLESVGMKKTSNKRDPWDRPDKMMGETVSGPVTEYDL